MRPKIIHALKMLENSIIVICVSGMLITVFYGVLVRYLPISSSQMAWTDELARLFLVWMAFFTMAVAQRENSHFTVDLIRNKLPLRPRLALTLFIFILSCLFLVYIIFNSFKIMQISIGDKSPVLQFPLVLFSLALFSSTCLMFIYTILHTITVTKELTK